MIGVTAYELPTRHAGGIINSNLEYRNEFGKAYSSDLATFRQVIEYLINILGDIIMYLKSLHLILETLSKTTPLKRHGGQLFQLLPGDKAYQLKELTTTTRIGFAFGAFFDKPTPSVKTYSLTLFHPGFFGFL